MTALAFKKYLHVQFFPCFMHMPMYVVRGMLFGHLWEGRCGGCWPHLPLSVYAMGTHSTGIRGSWYQRKTELLNIFFLLAIVSEVIFSQAIFCRALFIGKPLIGAWRKSSRASYHADLSVCYWRPCGVEQLQRDKRSFVLILHLPIFLILNTCVFMCDIWVVTQQNSIR